MSASYTITAEAIEVGDGRGSTFTYPHRSVDLAAHLADGGQVGPFWAARTEVPAQLRAAKGALRAEVWVTGLDDTDLVYLVEFTRKGTHRVRAAAVAAAGRRACPTCGRDARGRAFAKSDAYLRCGLGHVYQA